MTITKGLVRCGSVAGLLAVALMSATIFASTAHAQNPPATPAPAQGQVAGMAPGVALETPRDHLADAIPGVVAAGEKVELISGDITSGDGIIGLPDGNAAFVQLRPGQLIFIAPDKKISPVLSTPGVKSIGADSEGNVIALLQDSFEIVYPVARARVLAGYTEAHAADRAAAAWAKLS